MIQKKLTIFVTLFLFLFVWQYPSFTKCGDSPCQQEANSERRIEYGENNQSIKVYETEELVFKYHIDDFQKWAEEEWETLFPEPPSFGDILTVHPEELTFFEKSAALSPGNEQLAFSLHRYFAASFMTFTGIVDLSTKKTDLVAAENMGSISDIMWSPKGTHIAYTLHTGRARGDYLSVDNVEKMEKKFTLSEEDIADVLQPDKEYFMPHFNNLQWTKDNERLNFTTRAPSDGNDKKVLWSVNRKGNDVTIESREVKEKE